MFRNVTFFRYPGEIDASALEAHVPHVPLKPVGAMEVASIGFIAPGVGEVGEELPLVETGESFVYLAVGIEQKVIPTAAVNHRLAKRLKEIEEREGRRLGGRARKRIKDEVVAEILPNALVKPERIDVVIDVARSVVAVGTASRKKAESVVSLIRMALGSFPALPIATTTDPRAVMTSWVSGEALPDGFALADEAALKGADGEASAMVKGIDLQTEEVQEHIAAGMRVVRLRLNLCDQLEFTVDEAMVCRGIASFFEPDVDDESLDSLRLIHSHQLRDLFDALSGAFKFAEL